jgi:hypothetical protein
VVATLDFRVGGRGRIGSVPVGRSAQTTMADEHEMNRISAVSHGDSLACKDVTEFITDYLEGDLPLSVSTDIRLHQTTCRGCSAYFRQMRTTVRVLGSLPPRPIPTDTRETLLTYFRYWKQASQLPGSTGGVA